MEPKTQIEDAIYSILNSHQNIERSSVKLDVPKDIKNGDLTTNVCLQMARLFKSSPKDVASIILKEINLDALQIDKIDIAGPGFINITLKKNLLTKIIDDVILSGSSFGQYPSNGERILIEFVSVNPTGDIHIGHARGAAAGSTLSNILKKAGYEVEQEYYVNDGGNQINILAESLHVRYQQLLGIDVKLDEDAYHGEDIIRIAKQIKAEYGEKFINNFDKSFFKEYGVNSLLENIKRDLDVFGVTFDRFFYESKLHNDNDVQATVDQLANLGYTYKKENALWLKTSDFFDEKDRVIQKGDGSFTYLTPDIAYHVNKYQRGYNRLINILGSDHHGYINRLKSSMKMLGHNENDLDVLLLQMVKVIQNGEEVKMSKRSGKAITLSDLMDEVSRDPIRYFFAMRSLNTQMDLDLDLALRKSNENPVFYVQYAHARIESIMKMASEKGLDFNDFNDQYRHIETETEQALLNQFTLFKETIVSASETLEPHKVTNYLKDLATLVHRFYNETKVLNGEESASIERLRLLKAAQIILKNGLQLVGVSAPLSM
jgi:arginyl-tRNA synthetase